MVSAYLNLGNAYHRVGNFKRAVTYLQLYLKIVKDGGDQFQEAPMLIWVLPITTREIL